VSAWAVGRRRLQKSEAPRHPLQSPISARHQVAVAELARAGDGNSGARLLHRECDVPLDQVRALVDRLERGDALPSTWPEVVADLDSSVRYGVLELDGSGRRTDALRTLRRETGLGPWEAAEALRALEAWRKQG
jgi:hypothetical protein